MHSEIGILILALARHLMWSRTNDRGETTTYYYYDETTWVIAALALAWLTWFFVTRYLRARSLRRPPQRTDHRALKRIVRIKNELSSQYLQLGFSSNIHAIGIGMLGGDYCIQVFVDDVNEARRTSAPPNSYRDVPVILIEMPRAAFLADAGLSSEALSRYPNGIREYQEVIIGGISAANTNLAGQSGTIGYFCTRKSKLPRRKEVHLLSNSHVFADLRKERADEDDLIMQPSPGEPDRNRPIAALVSFCPLIFSGDVSEPNHIDAAIAKLWTSHQHKPVLPLIGAIKGYVVKKHVEVSEAARKFGRTTGYTEGRVFSIYLDIWIRYDRTRQSAFFKDQLLIEPTLPSLERFVDKGDSGSLVVDGKQNALGLIFAGMSDAPESTPLPAESESDQPAEKPTRIEGYGVANPISEVLDRLRIELLI